MFKKVPPSEPFARRQGVRTYHGTRIRVIGLLELFQRNGYVSLALPLVSFLTCNRISLS